MVFGLLKRTRGEGGGGGGYVVWLRKGRWF